MVFQKALIYLKDTKHNAQAMQLKEIFKQATLFHP